MVGDVGVAINASDELLDIDFGQATLTSGSKFIWYCDKDPIVEKDDDDDNDDDKIAVLLANSFW